MPRAAPHHETDSYRVPRRFHLTSAYTTRDGGALASRRSAERTCPMRAVRRVLLVPTLFVLVLVSASWAATFTVDTTADDATKSTCDDATANDCSLRGAVTAANANPDHDTI